MLEDLDMREMVERTQRSDEAARRYYLGPGVELKQQEIMRMGLPPRAFVE